MTITVINFGLGNIASVSNMIRKVGGEVNVCNTPDNLRYAEKILLPGVGSFDCGMQLLKKGGWLNVLREAVIERQVPILGICLCMHLMCISSEEGKDSGLGWVKAEVKRFDLDNLGKLKVPHMGWSTIKTIKENPLLDEVTQNERFYFVHSYYVKCNDDKNIIATAEYGEIFTAAFHYRNIFGVQFHPEKSHRFGMKLMKKFVDLPC